MRFQAAISVLHTVHAVRPLPMHMACYDSTKNIISRRAVCGGAAISIGAGLPISVGASGPAIFTPPTGSLQGTTIVITGANTGLGLESAKRLAAADARVVVTARTQVKADAAVSAVKSTTPQARVVGVELDLASLSSVRTFVSRLEAAIGDDAVDVLMNNAGVMAIPERLSTEDGFERTIGVNHLGHFALVASLLPTLKRASSGFRIVNLSSDAHRFVTPSAMSDALSASLDELKYSTWGVYGISKAANVLFTEELQRRFDKAGLQGSAVSLHPGVVQTDLARYIIGGLSAGDTRLSETAPEPTGLGALVKGALDKVILTVPQGANTQVYLAAATDTGGDRTKRAGSYFDKMVVAKPSEASTDPMLALRLWELSEKLTGAKIDI
eukprot:CAMPEP_0119302440 /NCGR_PEP_ID=MMETSP1333-20130426/4031_1 /TAXON_ID=418940 /ORGANISM="Scyphosphaera apsteinii, Strain RCC1455" /LENGTH=383 /DNA_ID=CAMNT_0007304787 /DNA_START=29 /DNA_END=1180 /DNA_ORIENTATION=+